jgi:type II secretory pathway component PulF
MAIYDYRGVTQKGKNTRGIIDAPGTSAARDKLRTQGIYLQELSEVKKTKTQVRLGTSFFKKRASVASITRQLSFLLGASLPVDSALEGVIDQAEESDIKKMMISIKEKVKEGKSISQAFGDYPDYFNKLYVSTLHAGEVSGKLGQVFERLSSMYEKNRVLMGKLRTSLTYPALMLFLAFLIIIFLVSFLIPTFAKLFIEFGQVLPLPTRVLMGISKVVTAGWWAILLAIGLLVFIFIRIYKGEKGKSYFDSLALKFPIVKTLVLETFRVRFAYTMALLLSNGVGIIESLETTEGIFKNSIFKNLLSNAIDRVKKGEKLSRALASGTVFNSSLLGMIHAGEAGDRVADVLDKIGYNAEIEVEEKLKTLTALIEPVIIMIIGIFIGFVVLAIMLPIFQINQIF